MTQNSASATSNLIKKLFVSFISESHPNSSLFNKCHGSHFLFGHLYNHLGSSDPVIDPKFCFSTLKLGDIDCLSDLCHRFPKL